MLGLTGTVTFVLATAFMALQTEGLNETVLSAKPFLPPGFPCPIGEFPCGNSSVCLEQSKHCDGVEDCENGADERNCGDITGWGHDFDKTVQVFDWDSYQPPRADICILPDVPAPCNCSHETRVYCDGKGLHTVPTDIPTNTTKLYVQDNNITVVMNESFINYTKLVSLNLQRNNIRVIQRSAFKGLRNLQKLYLNYNLLETLEPFTFKDMKTLTWLYLDDNRITTLQHQTFFGLQSLFWLDLRENRISHLRGEAFCEDMPSLRWMELDQNRIQRLCPEMFAGCANLTILRLRNNSITSITRRALDTLTGLEDLDLSWNQVSVIPDDAFKNMQMLLSLNLSMNPIERLQLDLFDGLANLTSLDLGGLTMHNLSYRLFRNLKKLDFIYFSQFRYCGFAPHVRSCKPNTDGISSLENLLANVILRMAVWVVAILICLGNTSVMIGRTVMKQENKVHSLFIRNLCASDLIMGIYLLIIGSKDHVYRDVYNQYAQEWKQSYSCHITGFFGMLSAEVTVLLLTYMSVERFLCVVFPYRESHPNVRQAGTVIAIIWVAGVTLAAIPFTSSMYFGNFYGSNGVCFPLHLHEPYGNGWEYSAFIFLGINFTSLTVILFAYIGMFISIHRTRRSLKSPLSLLSDMSFAKRFFFIVLTDSLVWIPITVMKFMALTNAPISGSLYAWIVIFILPINSAINPILYSLTTRTFTNMLGNLVEKSPFRPVKAKCPTDGGHRDEVSATTGTTGLSLKHTRYHRGKRCQSETESSMSMANTSPLATIHTPDVGVPTVDGEMTVRFSKFSLDSVPEIPSNEEEDWDFGYGISDICTISCGRRLVTTICEHSISDKASVKSEQKSEEITEDCQESKYTDTDTETTGL
ncbi:relaxin receptor 1-like isoform X1 [Branchiostoma floridae]|uniref:Relaxin receptor 1-like isoform X1 n=1 Tax=Branchiostoma floridae TaxID=7739 RepID=A0A9J7LG04_BRAFL|nr:relaxin receptor 1-like isoform X1 [Branchiostoma floridae]